jgi:hypothetical protein
MASPAVAGGRPTPPAAGKTAIGFRPEGAGKTFRDEIAATVPLPLKMVRILGIRLRPLMARIEIEGFLEAPDKYYRVK